jgi:hypothetical protein
VLFFNFILRAVIVDSVVQCVSPFSLAIDGFPPQHQAQFGGGRGVQIQRWKRSVPPCALSPRQQHHRCQPCVAHASPQNGQSRGSGTLTCGSARLYWICSGDASQSLSVDWPTIIMSVWTPWLSFYRVFCSIRVAFDCPCRHAVSREASCPCIVCHLDTKCHPVRLQCAPWSLPATATSIVRARTLATSLPQVLLPALAVAFRRALRLTR